MNLLSDAWTVLLVLGSLAACVCAACAVVIVIHRGSSRPRRRD